MKQLGAELARIGVEVTGTHLTADIAILHDWNAWWAGSQDGRPSTEVDYPDVLRAWHRALWESHHTTDLAHPEHDLTAYKLVVVPQLYLLTDTAIDNLLAYVRAGGTLVSGFLTGIADEDDRVRPGGMDPRLRELFGIRTLHEWWPLDAGETVECEGFRGTLWSEEIEPEDDGVDEVMPYKGGELDGLPAVLRRGRSWYVSTLPEPDALRDLLARVAADAGVRPVLAGLPRAWRPCGAESCCSSSTTAANQSPSISRAPTGTCSPTRPSGAGSSSAATVRQCCAHDQRTRTGRPAGPRPRTRHLGAPPRRPLGGRLPQRQRPPRRPCVR